MKLIYRNYMVDVIIENLEKGKYLLNNIDDEQYDNKSIAPYYSSIGGHMRHILDMFNCVFKGLSLDKCVDLTLRERNLLAETQTKIGINYIDNTILELKQLKKTDINQTITIVDDLGNGKYTAPTSLSAVLIQAHSHAIHHFATIGYLIHHLGITLPIDSFGVNPTTPKERLVSHIAK